jgi:hypothetical protein
LLKINITTHKFNKFINEIHLIPKIMTPNLRLSIELLVDTIAIVLISWISIPAANAQPNPPAPETTPQPPQTSTELTQAPSYIGVGGVIGIQGGTTSLSQGTFSILTKQVLTENLAIHNANTIFGSLTPSSSIALTYNRPMSGEGVPIVFTPFIGAGIMTHYNNGMSISPHLTGGVDVSTPLLNLTGTLRVNAGFVSDRSADVGVLFGIGFSN